MEEKVVFMIKSVGQQAVIIVAKGIQHLIRATIHSGLKIRKKVQFRETSLHYEHFWFQKRPLK